MSLLAAQENASLVAVWQQQKNDLADRLEWLTAVISSHLRLLSDDAHVNVIGIRSPCYSLYTVAKH